MEQEERRRAERRKRGRREEGGGVCEGASGVHTSASSCSSRFTCTNTPTVTYHSLRISSSRPRSRKPSGPTCNERGALVCALRVCCLRSHLQTRGA